MKTVNGMSVTRSVAIKVIERIPQLNNLKGKKYYEVEGIITEVLDENLFDLYCDYEHTDVCNDVVTQMQSKYGIDCSDNTEFQSDCADEFISNYDSDCCYWDQIDTAIYCTCNAFSDKYFAYLAVVADGDSDDDV